MFEFFKNMYKKFAVLVFKKDINLHEIFDDDMKDDIESNLKGVDIKFQWYDENNDFLIVEGGDTLNFDDDNTTRMLINVDFCCDYNFNRRLLAKVVATEIAGNLGIKRFYVC